MWVETCDVFSSYFFIRLFYFLRPVVWREERKRMAKYLVWFEMGFDGRVELICKTGNDQEQ